MTTTPKDLRAWRAREELTQAESAKLAGVGIRTWQRWEYGERSVPHWLRDLLTARYGSGP